MTKFFNFNFYNNFGDNMKVKIFDESHEKDLETKINDFLTTLEGEVIDIKFETAIMTMGDEQIYCFSAMIIYI